jgi:hypothetical protein
MTCESGDGSAPPDGESDVCQVEEVSPDVDILGRSIALAANTK